MVNIENVYVHMIQILQTVFMASFSLRRYCRSRKKGMTSAWHDNMETHTHTQVGCQCDCHFHPFCWSVSKANYACNVTNLNVTSKHGSSWNNSISSPLVGCTMKQLQYMNQKTKNDSIIILRSDRAYRKTELAEASKHYFKAEVTSLDPSLIVGNPAPEDSHLLFNT